MKVECTKSYYDLELKKEVVKGEVFEVSDTRGKALTTNANKVGYPLCKELKTPTTEKVVKQGKKKEEA